MNKSVGQADIYLVIPIYYEGQAGVFARRGL